MMKLALAALLPASAIAGGTFSYDPDSDKNPTAWASLDIPGNECGGSSQSGIDVPRTGCDVYDDYVFAAGSCSLDDIKFTLSDHAIYGHYDTTNGCQPPRMEIPGQPNPFEAVQFHIHTGTDHAINGRYFGADMHLVHAEVGGDRFSVLGYFLEPTSPSGIAKFSDLIAEWEKVEDGVFSTCTGEAPATSTTNSTGGRRLGGKQDERRLPRSFDYYSLMPEGATIYTYDGGLTTPPCSEVVFWNVVDTPVSISIREFLRMTNVILDYVDPETCTLASVAAPSGFTGRPVQNINGRAITRHCPTSMKPMDAE